MIAYLQVENKKVMIRLWVHEVFRVFYDRLTDDDDRAWLFEVIKRLVKEEFKENFEGVFEHLTEDSKIKEADLRSLMFGEFESLILDFTVIECRSLF